MKRRRLTVAAREIAAETHGSRRFRAQRGVLWRCTLRVRASKGGGSAAIELTGQRRWWVAARAAWWLAAAAVGGGAEPRGGLARRPVLFDARFACRQSG
jgi:hypothetical protein